MKITLASTVLISFLINLVSSELYDVTIRPKCQGVDFSKLTAAETEYVGDVLETTYNQLHQLWDGGDKYLFGIESNTAAPEMAELTQGSGFDDSYWHGGGACGYTCSYAIGCVDDFYTWMYDDDSVFCSNNDAILAVTKNTKTKADRLWEKSFTEKLTEGPYPVFHDVKKCDLTMLTDDSGEPPVQGGSAVSGAGFTETKSVNVFLSCKEGTFENLAGNASKFLAETLMTAYSLTHDNDELMFGMVSDPSKSGATGMSFTADWGCHKCENADDKDKNNLYLRGKENKPWADYFVHGLKKSPFSELKELNKCKITSMFSPNAKVASIAETAEKA